MTSKTVKVIIVLPTFGAPFLWKNKIYNTKQKEKKTELFNDCRTIVCGDVEEWSQCSDLNFFIHPLFVRDNPRWAVADKLIEKKDTKIWVNENGMNECSANMACPVRHKDYSGISVISKEVYDRLPTVIRKAPMFGNIALVVPLSSLSSYGGTTAFSLVNTYDDDWYEPYEPYDDEEMEAKKKECKEKGYDFRESTGQIYVAKVDLDDAE